MGRAGAAYQGRGFRAVLQPEGCLFDVRTWLGRFKNGGSGKSPQETGGRGGGREGPGGSGFVVGSYEAFSETNQVLLFHDE